MECLWTSSVKDRSRGNMIVSPARGGLAKKKLPSLQGRGSYRTEVRSNLVVWKGFRLLRPENGARKGNERKMAKKYYIYIMTNKFNTVLYTGVTYDLKKQIYQHKQKMAPGFTSKSILINQFIMKYLMIVTMPFRGKSRLREAPGRKSLIWLITGLWQILNFVTLNSFQGLITGKMWCWNKFSMTSFNKICQSPVMILMQIGLIYLMSCEIKNWDCFARKTGLAKTRKKPSLRGRRSYRTEGRNNLVVRKGFTNEAP